MERQALPGTFSWGCNFRGPCKRRPRAFGRLRYGGSASLRTCFGPARMRRRDIPTRIWRAPAGGFPAEFPVLPFHAKELLGGGARLPSFAFDRVMGFARFSGEGCGSACLRLERPGWRAGCRYRYFRRQLFGRFRVSSFPCMGGMSWSVSWGDV